MDFIILLLKGFASYISQASNNPMLNSHKWHNWFLEVSFYQRSIFEENRLPSYRRRLLAVTQQSNRTRQWSSNFLSQVILDFSIKPCVLTAERLNLKLDEYTQDPEGSGVQLGFYLGRYASLELAKVVGMIKIWETHRSEEEFSLIVVAPERDVNRSNFSSLLQDHKFLTISIQVKMYRECDFQFFWLALDFIHNGFGGLPRGYLPDRRNLWLHFLRSRFTTPQNPRLECDVKCFCDWLKKVQSFFVNL